MNIINRTGKYNRWTDHLPCGVLAREKEGEERKVTKRKKAGKVGKGRDLR